MIIVSVSSAKTSSSEQWAFGQLVRDLEKIRSYDGTTVTVQVAYQGGCSSVRPLSLFRPGRSLSSITQEALARADASTSPHYRGHPRGQPWPRRVQAAEASIRERVRAEIHSIMPQTFPKVYTNRAEYIRDNIQNLEQKWGHRGGFLDHHFRNAIAEAL